MPPESAYFLQVNRGKRSLTLDFKKEAGKEVLRALIKEADVLVSWIRQALFQTERV